MNDQSVSPGPVAPWARVLAWIIVAGSCLAAVGVVMGVIRGARLPPFPWYVLVVFAIAVVWGLPLFWIVAIRGRPPKYWLGLGPHHWQSH
jgi:hypothetical protein